MFLVPIGLLSARLLLIKTVLFVFLLKLGLSTGIPPAFSVGSIWAMLGADAGLWPVEGSPFTGAKQSKPRES